MKATVKLLLSFMLALTAASVFADDREPGSTEITMDIKMVTTELRMRVDGVPIFDPAEPFSIDSHMETQIPLDVVMSPGTNRVTFDLKIDPDKSRGFEGQFHVQFGYAPAGVFLPSFEGRPVAGGFEVTIGDSGDVPIEMLSSYVHGQPYLTATKARRIAGTGIAGTWNTYEMELTVGKNLPPFAWKSGQILTIDDQTEAEITNELRAVHAALVIGFDASVALLAPMIEQRAALIGISAEQYAEVSFGPMFEGGEGEFKVQEFDPSGSELQLFGNGRLATLVPVPLILESEKFDEIGTIYMYFWKDANDQWQVLH